MAKQTMDFIELSPVTLDADPLDSYPLDSYPLDSYPLDSYPLDNDQLDSINDVEPNFDEANVDMLLPPIALSPHQAKPPVKVDDNGKFLCSTCGRGFSNLANLRNHCRQIHELSGTYKCDICDKTFTCKNNFLGHKNKHTKERPYECGSCGKRYMYKQSLNAHVKHCSPDTKASKRYYCVYCKLSFKCSKYLKEHNKALHSNATLLYACECGDRFKWRSALKKHRDNECMNREMDIIVTNHEEILSRFLEEDWSDLC